MQDFSDVQYVSTRGGTNPTNFADVAMAGLAPDGGLFMPQEFPDLRGWDWSYCTSYHHVAHKVLSALAPDLRADVLFNMLRKTYNADVFCNATDGDNPNDIIPVRQLGESLYLLRLANGPTGAFKDVALQLLGYVFEHLLEERDQTMNILGATSGDTGSAAIHAMLGRDRIASFILSPAHNMTNVQEAQMWGVNDPYVHNLTVPDFDTGQRIVKGVSADLAFKEQYHIGSINSINWVRVAAQVVYYVWAGLKIHGLRAPFDVAVPTGNFGDICAAYVAKQMGVPIRRLILATNENDVLHDFFQTGVYAPRAEIVPTINPSMDINGASNFERQIYMLYGGDTEKVTTLWQNLAKKGSFDISGDMDLIRDTGFESMRVVKEMSMSAIVQTYCEHGIIIDPHTATAMYAAHHFDLGDGVPCVVAETAQPFKFEETILEALGTSMPRPEAFQGIDTAPRYKTAIEPTVEAVQQYIKGFARM